MAFVDKYPYTDFHELNLDWVLKKIKEVDKTVNDFTVFNKLTWAGVWSAAKSYVKWSIVQDENGNGYISIQPVPLNVPLTNEDYWQQIAKYEELYAAFDQRIEKNAGDINYVNTSLNSKIDSVNNDLNSKIDSVNNDLNGKINNVNDSLTKSINSLVIPAKSNMAHRKFIIVGDSYATTPSKDESFAAYCMRYLGTTNYENIAIAGENLNGWTNQVLNYAGNAKAVTDVIAVGGFNDIQGFQEIQNNVASFVNTVTNKFPNAVLWAGFAANGYLYGDKITVQTYYSLNYAEEAWKTVFPQFSNVVYMPNLRQWMLNIPSTDYVGGGSGAHPVGGAAYNLGYLVASQIAGGNPIYLNPYNDYHLYVKSLINGALGEIRPVLNSHNDFASLYINNFNFVMGEDLNITRDAYVPLFSLHDSEELNKDFTCNATLDYPIIVELANNGTFDFAELRLQDNVVSIKAAIHTITIPSQYEFHVQGATMMIPFDAF